MRLLEIEIQNYKSLRSVTLKPGALSVFIGPNGAGKSNLCDALDFIGEMHHSGLESAVALHGGYENISYRHVRRSKSPIILKVVASLTAEEALFEWELRTEQQRPSRKIIVDHRIAFGASDQSIRAPFRIIDESIEYSFELAENDQLVPMLSASRQSDKIVHLSAARSSRSSLQSSISMDPDSTKDFLERRLTSTESFIRALSLYAFPLFPIRRSFGSIDIYQLNPSSCRNAGIPTPNPELRRDGENLPAVIDALKTRSADAYKAFLDTLRVIMPTLEDIDIVNTPQRTLGLAFQEAGFGRPWTSDDVSDGTIRALGLLASLFSPDSEVVIIEEPENSLHPWAIGQFVEACRVASESKQVMLTTHSPVLINHLRPGEIWVVERPKAETKVTQLVELDADARVGWEEGRFTLSEYLHSGIVPGAVPAAPM